jgi:hypothetical protein
LNDAAKPFCNKCVAKFIICTTTAADKNNFKVGADNGWKLAELNVGQAALY